MPRRSWRSSRGKIGIVIADVTVKRVKGRDVTVGIDSERSDIVVNGKKVSQLTPGAKVKLTTR